MPNLLNNETSPYLLAHSENPVDWYPWGDTAFAVARERNLPILASIGYATCHWCHVMERESFEDQETADLMNAHFVCVKVDREERPDIDSIYMDAAQAITGQGGWPLTVFLTSDGIPFYAGTYFPPEPRHGLPAFKDLLNALSQAWNEERDQITAQSAQVLERLKQSASSSPSTNEPMAEQLEQLLARLEKLYDREHPGFGRAPKFPSAPLIEYLLIRAAGKGGDRERAEEIALSTLRAMATGGIYDQLGGGFARYSTDREWVVPHFEKMLYDNALLARCYLHGWQLSKDPELLRVCTETLDWTIAELKQEDGGFAAAVDADSEGVEGKFYLWTQEEVYELLEPSEAKLAIEAFGISEQGNFEGATVLTLYELDRSSELSVIRKKLFEARSQRVHPNVDTKRVTSWNALLITAFAEAGVVLNRDDYISEAVAAADFILEGLTAEDGTLLRSYNIGRAQLPAMLEDYALFAQAVLKLYEATAEAKWFNQAQRLTELMIDRFHDARNGGFYSTKDDMPNTVIRRKDLDDSPLPSGSSAAALALIQISRYSGNWEYESLASGTIKLAYELALEQPSAFGHLLAATNLLLSPSRELALIGPDQREFLDVIYSEFRPHLTIARSNSEMHDSPPTLITRRAMVNGETTAYLCEQMSCKRPTTNPREVENNL